MEAISEGDRPAVARSAASANFAASRTVALFGVPSDGRRFSGRWPWRRSIRSVKAPAAALLGNYITCGMEVLGVPTLAACPCTVASNCVYSSILVYFWGADQAMRRHQRQQPRRLQHPDIFLAAISGLLCEIVQAARIDVLRKLFLVHCSGAGQRRSQNTMQLSFVVGKFVIPRI
jgi:hypothetical protein